MSKKEKFEDDGRQIANMNIEGMPWYDKERAMREQMGSDIMAACLVIGLIFVGTAFLFILFCVYVWL